MQAQAIRRALAVGVVAAVGEPAGGSRDLVRELQLDSTFPVAHSDVEETKKIPADDRDVQSRLFEGYPERNAIDLPTGHLGELSVHYRNVAHRGGRSEVPSSSPHLLLGSFQGKSKVLGKARMEQASSRSRIKDGVEGAGPAPRRAPHADRQQREWRKALFRCAHSRKGEHVGPERHAVAWCGQ